MRGFDEERDIEQVKVLLKEYEASLSVDLDFQSFVKELEELPGEYAPPTGVLLTLTENGALAGCVALRRQSEGVCEMKRLYVRSAFRGRGFGPKLVSAIIESAKRLGYTRMRLDTLPEMSYARRLYESYGFKQIEPYYDNPVDGTQFLELELG